MFSLVDIVAGYGDTTVLWDVTVHVPPAFGTDPAGVVASPPASSALGLAAFCSTARMSAGIVRTTSRNSGSAMSPKGVASSAV